MTNTNNLIIFSSKKKIFIQIVLNVAFISLGIWLLFHNEKFGNSFFEKYKLGYLIGGLSISIFGSFLLFWILILLRKSPAIVIDHNGITENSTFISLGKIPWSDIDSVRTTKVNSVRLITLILNDPKKYIDKQKSFFKRKIMIQNFKKNGSPISIQTTSLLTNHETLKQVIENKLRENKEMIQTES